MANLMASDVQIPTSLSSQLGGIGTNAYNTIGASYNTAKKQIGQGASAFGGNTTKATGPASYAGQQFGTQQGLATGNLEAALGSGLGNTSYQNQLQQRDFGQNEQLAEQAAALNKPDMLSQILSGLGGVGKTVGAYYGATKGAGGGGGSGGVGSTTGSLPPNLSLYPGGGAAQYYGGY